MTLSIVIPVYNESRTIGRILALVAETLPEVTKEIVIVDDGSTDGTREWLAANLGQARGPYAAVAEGPGGTLGLVEAASEPAMTFRVHFHERNQGKGGALRTGLALATGDVIVIQDADLEYDPQDWARMYPLIATRRVADVVYGSRFYGEPHRSLYFHHFLANRLISFLFNVIYNQTLTDIEVCYKMFTRAVRDTLALTCRDFGIEIEISAQVARNPRWRIYEVGIRYYGRTYREGKKIGWKDGVKALWYVLRFRFARLPG